ncbi:helix-turn-helix transcriptional regulator [Natrinema sp. H-ect4]|uniref:helix-turn-helix transcriptional regulator n=1 Tax=Natrinema sp. H-ect4 TaxID=3242699 RepID=UPI0035A87720
MKLIREILKQLEVDSVDDLEVNQEITVENGDFPELNIKKVDGNHVIVGHYYRRMGEVKACPEIIFKVKDGEWIPIRYTQSQGIHRHDKNGLQSGQKFVKQWSRTLKSQGFVDAAKKQGNKAKSLDTTTCSTTSPRKRADPPVSPAMNVEDILEKYGLTKETTAQYIDAVTRMSQAETAEELEVSRGTVNRYKNAFDKMTCLERIQLTASLSTNKLLQQISENIQE